MIFFSHLAYIKNTLESMPNDMQNYHKLILKEVGYMSSNTLSDIFNFYAFFQSYTSPL